MQRVIKGLLIIHFFLVPKLVFASNNVTLDTGATAWMLTSTALVLLMVPGLAMFYSGLVRTKNVIGTIMHSFVAMGVMTLLWVSFGYAMSFGHNVLGGWFGWNWDYLFLKGLDDSILKEGVPEYVFAMFQGKFAIIAPALIAGAFAERISFKAYIIFISLWGIFVYNPICHWVWASDGFLFNLGPIGAIDFAGGTVVHISAGVSGLVAAIYLGRRRIYRNEPIPPSNLTMTMIGAGLLWVGWFGFNAGSSVSSSLKTAQALTVTQIAAASGAFSWIIIETIHQGKATALGFASGILAGLVAITPAAGAVLPWAAIIIGSIASLLCYYAIILKSQIGYDDSLDVFGIHGIGGIAGALFLTFFVRKDMLLEAGKTIHGSWSVWQQFGVQFSAVVIAILYAAMVTFIILFIVNRISPLRVTQKEEMAGLDHTFHGEHGYGMLNPN